MAAEKVKRNDLKEKLHSIIFEAETPAGKAFDIALLIIIVASVVVVMLESVERFETKYGDLFRILEWIFTVFFTIEYILRIYCVYKPWKYIKSPLGIIDLASTLPTYLSLFIPDTHTFMVIRLLRLLRIFRLLKLGSFMRSGMIITKALKESRTKIAVFMFFVLIVVTIVGTVMYFVEGNVENSTFTSIPRSIYWAIVTITTVGYGDITPVT
ncbi:MAG: ion transporter, partial [Bacteroidota bacterium]